MPSIARGRSWRRRFSPADGAGRRPVGRENERKRGRQHRSAEAPAGHRALAQLRQVGLDHRLAVAPGDLFGKVVRQVGQPLPGPVGVPGDIVPALRREGVGVDRDAVREDGEQAAPVVLDPAAMSMFAAEGQVGPQVRVLPEHRAGDIRIDEAGMGPQHTRFRPLGEDPIDRAGIRMGVQEEIVLPR